MSEISDRYRRLSARFAARVALVPDDQWSAPTPCEDWTVRELVGHVVDSQGLFLGLVGRELGDVPSVGDDPHGAFLAASARVQADLDDPSLSAETFEGVFGTTRFDTAVDRFVSMDLVVHGWDLSRAIGIEDDLPEDEIERLLTVDVPGFGDMLYAPGVVADPVPVPADAPAQDRLLGLLGRTP